MKYLLTTLCLLTALSSHAQSNTNKVQEAIDFFMNADNPTDGLRRLKEVISLVEKQPDTLKSNYYVSLGICYGQMGKSDSSFLFLDRAEAFAESAKSDFLQIKVNNTRGLVYMSLGQYDESLAAYQKSMDLAEGREEVNFKEALRKTYGNAGGIFYQLGQLDKAAELTEKALRISEALNDSSGIAYNHLRLALVQNDMSELDKGIYHLDQATTYFRNLGDTTTLLYAENTFGQVLEKKGELDKAIMHYLKANALARAIGDQEEVAYTLLSVASAQLKKRNFEEAKKYGQMALEFSEKNNFPNSIKRAHDILYKHSLAKNSYKEALEHRNAYITLSDSLNGVEMKQRVAELETKYETEKKEAEIQRLALEGDLKDANLAKAKNAQYAIAIGGGMAMILLAVFFILRNQKLRAEREAQELQVEALKKRFMELHASPSELAVEMDFLELNEKLHTALTEREFDALKLSIEGKSNTEIADKLFISVSTVKFHLRNAYGKMGVGNRKEAFQFMLKTS